MTESYQHVCPECRYETTFSESGSYKLLTCEDCGYIPRRYVRMDIREAGRCE